MAKLWTRILARIIDALIFAGIALVGGFIFDIIIFKNDIFHWMYFTYFMFLSYNIIMHVIYGQTIGKRIMQIKLVGEQNWNINFIRVIVREVLVFIIIYFMQILEIADEYLTFHPLHENIIMIINTMIPIIDISPYLKNSRNPLLHDFLLKTKVVNV